jgi:hypothetical protein
MFILFTNCLLGIENDDIIANRPLYESFAHYLRFRLDIYPQNPKARACPLVKESDSPLSPTAMMAKDVLRHYLFAAPRTTCGIGLIFLRIIGLRISYASSVS